MGQFLLFGGVGVGWGWGGDFTMGQGGVGWGGLLPCALGRWRHEILVRNGKSAVAEHVGQKVHCEDSISD